MHGVPVVVTSSHGHRHAHFLAAVRPSRRSLDALCVLALVALALVAAAVHTPLAARLAASHAKTPAQGTSAAAAVSSAGAAAVGARGHSVPGASRPSILPLPLDAHHARGHEHSSATGNAPIGDAASAVVSKVDATAGAGTTESRSEPLTDAAAAETAAAAAAAATEPSTAASEAAAAYLGDVPAQCSMQRSTDYDGDALTWGLDFHTASAADCCARCQAMAATADAGAGQGGGAQQQWCNIWVFCPEPGGCWSPDIWDHKHKECWLKHGDPPKMNFQGRYADEFRAMHPTAPEAVQWVAGVI
ncbi:hypothetical protein CLOM_g9278 [Closterium sp. NIES-68]|nr:hypothetical protein CLOM_g9278 [Closterium sp. NIES-68]